MTPTFEASLLQPEIERVFKHVSGLNDIAHELRRQSFGQINMATIPTLSASLLPSVIKSWRTKHPAARARVQVLSTTEVVSLVANHLVDFGLIHTHASESELQVEEILRTEMYCAMPKGHPLAVHEVIRPDMLREQSLIAARHSLDAVTESAFRDVGEPFDVAIEVNNSLTACILAANGVGLALVDPFALSLGGSQVEIRQFRPTISLSTRVLFSNKRPLSRLALEFVRLLRNAVSDIGAIGWGTRATAVSA
jgi:DNA-binding transcriptional LysR family regulator